MKKIKKKISIIIVLLVIISTLGITYAYMFSQTEVLDNQFIPAVVDCEVDESYDKNLNRKDSIKVYNTGNIEAYVRVRLVTYWVDDDGKVMPKASQMPTFSITSDWIDAGDYTYYYKSKVSSLGYTSEMLLSSMQLTTSAEGYNQVVEVIAEAIQANPVDAVQNSWNVTVGSDGDISK